MRRFDANGNGSPPPPLCCTYPHVSPQATDLARLELAYAPPFGSARDVVNVLGMAIENAATGLVRVERARNLASLPPGRAVLDVRDATSAAVHALSVGNGTAVINVPMTELRRRLPGLDHTLAYTAVCGKGKLAYFAARTLSQAREVVARQLLTVCHNSSLCLCYTLRLVLTCHLLPAASTCCSTSPLPTRLSPTRP